MIIPEERTGISTLNSIHYSYSPKQQIQYTWNKWKGFALTQEDSDLIIILASIHHSSLLECFDNWKELCYSISIISQISLKCSFKQIYGLKTCQIWLLLLHSIITLKLNWMTMTEWIASNRYGFKWRQVFQSFLTFILTNQINIISIIEVIGSINSSNGDGSELRKIG